MADLLPWMKALVARIPSEPESIIQDELVYVIKDFCREAKPWRMVVTDLSIVADDPEIAVNPVDNRATCIDVLKVFVNDQEIGQAPYQVQGYSPGQPTGFTCPTPDVITLIPTPTTDDENAVSALVALAPRDPTVWVPDFFETHHFEAILDGTLGRFYNQPMKPFSDAELARYHLRRYRAKTRESADMARRGYTPYAQNWAFPGFGV